jgi:hypothetical protein
LQLLFCVFSQIIDVPFPKEAEDTEEDSEEDWSHQNSFVVVEANFDEVTSTSNFNFQMLQVGDVESPNSCAVVAISFNEIPSTLGVDSKVPCSPMAR